LTTDAGVIDQDYRDEIMVITWNRNKYEDIEIDKGDRIAQIIILPYLPAELKESGLITETGRGSFGSTGANAAIIKKDIRTDQKQDDDDKLAFQYGSQLNTRQQAQLEELVKEFEDITAIKFTNLSRTLKGFFHDVDTGAHPPIKQNPYRINPVYREWTKKEIEKLLEGGVIEETQSPWASPIVIAPKKEIIINKQTGERKEITAPRFCVDYRKLNEITRKDAYPMPLIDDLLETIGEEPKYFSSLDLYSGYHQIPLTREASEKSAFVTPDGQYKYLKMPFGMCNAPATFQRIMTEVFKDLIGKCVTIYIDDIQLYTRTFQDHVYYLEEIFSRLRNHGFYLKAKKCTLATHEMKYLGFIITKDGLKADPSKIEVMKAFQTPTNVSELRAFLGLI
jgi:hypothetical protein